jgi:hypothetical protein
MMQLNIVLKSAVLLCISFLLSGCHHDTVHDEAFLLTHPEALEQSLSRCQAAETEGASCVIVRRVANEFSGLVNERSLNPEGFGKKILVMQMKLGDLQKVVLAASGEKQKSLQSEYDAGRHEMDVYLAVVSATTSVSS